MSHDNKAVTNYKRDHAEGIGIAFRMCEALGLTPAERAMVLGFGLPIVTDEQLQNLHDALSRIDERVELIIDIMSALEAISGGDKENKGIPANLII